MKPVPPRISRRIGFRGLVSARAGRARAEAARAESRTRSRRLADMARIHALACAQVLAHRFLEARGAAFEPLLLLVGHCRLEHLDDALAADDARQRDRGAEARIVGAGLEHRTFAAHDTFGHAG